MSLTLIRRIGLSGAILLLLAGVPLFPTPAPAQTPALPPAPSFAPPSYAPLPPIETTEFPQRAATIDGDHLLTMTIGAAVGVGLVLAYHTVVPAEVVIGPGVWAVGAALLGLIIGDAWYQAGVFPPRLCPG